MRFVKPEIFLIAKSVPDANAIAKWLTHIGCENTTVNRYSGKAVGVTSVGTEDAKHKTNAERIIELAGRRCYLSFEPGLNPNVSKIRSNIVDYINNVLESGHGSVLEHYTATFAVEGVSRVFTGEMNRHRAGVAISEGSMRYIRYDDIPMVETPLIEMSQEEFERYMDMDDDTVHMYDRKRARTRDLFRRAFEQDEKIYKEFCEIWKEELAPESKFALKKHMTSLGRRTIGMGVATGGVWSFNTRALRHMCTMRCAEAAEEEICQVATMILKVMMDEEPVLFGDFNVNDKGFWGPKFVKV